MIKIKGKYGVAKVFTDTLEEAASNEILNIMNQEWIRRQRVSLMPDVHAGGGNSAPIGLTIIFNQISIPPSLVGSDIGCGITLFITDFKIDNKLELAKWLDENIRRNVPSGRIVHNGTSQMPERYKVLLDQNLFADFHLFNAINAYGTLGGGNHFIEAYELNGNLAIAVHSGSRSLGANIYSFYEKKARTVQQLRQEIEVAELIKSLKDQGRHKEIQSALMELKSKQNAARPENEISILTGDEAIDYLNDVEVVTEYAYYNRAEIFKSITKDLLKNENIIEVIDKPHNYIEVVEIDTKPRIILRKGAQSGVAGESVLIPINMRDGLIMGKVSGGSEVKDRNFSFPHGAGRVKSRSQARKELSLDVFKEQMTGIYSTSIGDETLDEAPDAYKSITEIAEHTVHLMEENSVKVLKPLYNYKGGKE